MEIIEIPCKLMIILKLILIENCFCHFYFIFFMQFLGFLRFITTLLARVIYFLFYLQCVQRLTSKKVSHVRVHTLAIIGSCVTALYAHEPSPNLTFVLSLPTSVL